MSDAERAELEEAEAVCRRFLAWDLKAEELVVGQVKKKLGKVLGKVDDE